MKRLLFLILLLFSATLQAMNVKSVDIGYEHVSGLTYRANVTFYLFEPSPVDTFLLIDWGDNTTSNLTVFTNAVVAGDLKKVVYSGVHTYSGPSTFVLSLNYKVRNTNVSNIPLSLNKSIYVESVLTVNPFVGSVTSPLFNNVVPLSVCIGQTAYIDLSATDQQGDVLKYELVACRDSGGVLINGYTTPAASNTFSIDQNSGILTWDMPMNRGLYNFLIRVDKFRNGIFLGSVMRDIVVFTIICQPHTPVLNVPNDTCVLAGNTLAFNVNASYTGNDTIVLSGGGSPLQLQNNPAIFNQPIKGKGSVSSSFIWNASCEHVSPVPYTMYFKAQLEDSLNNCNCATTFNNGSLGPFTASFGRMIGTPCSPGWDGTYYLWFGADSAAPRWAVSPAYDLTSGNFMVVFDLRFADHTGNPGTNCEGPDEPDEGVYLQYSINGASGPWVTMSYWDPSLSAFEGGHVTNLIRWNNYSIVVPDPAISAATRFRWIQTESTGAYYDHWGLDNIWIFKISDKTPVEKKVNLEVIAPAPKNLTVSLDGNNFDLQWNKASCTNAAGYKIYRKSDFYGYIPGECETGVPAYTGYTLIYTGNSVNDTTFTDTNNGEGFSPGNDYCYMVTAWFANGAESQASNEACIQMPELSPVITHVSVLSTSASGNMYIEWSKPSAFDTIANPGPFRYDLYYSAGISGNNWQFLVSKPGLNDTTYTHSLLNTSGAAWRYRVDLMRFSGGTYIKENASGPASSVFLSIVPHDQLLSLSWSYNVTWNNDSFAVFRYNPATLVFDSIATVTQPFYNDSGLVNGVQYCYKIKSFGHYSLSGYAVPLVNWSQESCQNPSDNEPPCIPVLRVIPDCNDISNQLIWSSPLTQCGDGDVAGYKIYFAPGLNSEMVLLSQINNPADTFFIHQGLNSIAGCYSVEAFDTSGNSSAMSNKICIDIEQCDLYLLPNVFTPDGDGSNDYFVPFPYDFVEKIDLKIFNRWGKLVFSTTDPRVLWDGKNMSSGEPCADGVYYYVCDVYEVRLEGVRLRTLKGTVTILKK